MFAIITLFIPFLGLLDTLHHGRLGIIPVHVHSRLREFDRIANGTPVTFEEAWAPFKLDSMTQFLDIPMICVGTILVSMLAFHLFSTTCYLKFMKHQALSISIMEAFHSILTPPLHVDWEWFYRQNNYKTSVTKFWNKYSVYLTVHSFYALHIHILI